MATDPPSKAQEGVTATNEVTNSNVEQELLMSNLNKIANYFVANQDMFNYATFRQVDGDGTNLVNRLRGVDNFDVFYKMKNSALSLMRPKIRLYKVLTELPGQDENNNSDMSKISRPANQIYREIKFSDTMGIERLATPQDYLKFESTKPSWRNVGLKSFSFKHDGRVNGPMDQDIDCTLELTFKSLKDVQASPPGEPPPEQGGVRYVDLITWSPAKINRFTDTYNPIHYKIKVMLGYTAPDPEQLRALNLTKGEVDAIKNIERHNMIMSLNMYDYKFDIKENGSVGLSIKFRGAIETTIASNQVNIFQSFIRAGSSASGNILKTRPNESASAVLDAMTIFSASMKQIKKPTCKDNSCKGRTALKQAIESAGYLGEVFKEEYAETGRFPREAGLKIDKKTGLIKVERSGKIYEFLKKDNNADRIKNRIKQKVSFFKKEVYKSFLTQIIDGNTSPDGPGTRLFCAQSSAQDIVKLVDDNASSAGVQEGEASVPLTDLENITPGVNLSESSPPSFKIVRGEGFFSSKKELNEAIRRDSEFGTESSSNDNEAGEETKKKDEAAPSLVSSDKNSFKFYFMFLGDIVELACKNAGVSRLDLKSDPSIPNLGSLIFNEGSYYDEKNAGSGYPLKAARMLLGPMEYSDEEDKIRKINLAQMPISFNLFRSWFIKKVVRSQRLQFSLGAFLNSLVKDLVIPSLSGVGMSKNRRAPRTRHSFVSMTLPGKRGPNGSLEELLPRKQVLNTESAEFNEGYFKLTRDTGYSSESAVKDSFDYLLLHITTHDDILKRRGDPVEDVRDGIYHFNIGSDQGLLKNMTFERVGIPGLAAARSLDNELLGGDSLDQLKFPYNTNLTLIGNTLFLPGMFYYVNPSLAGLGSVEDSTSLAYKMNLGGYHLVLEMSLKIQAGKFETKVVGFQQQ